MFVPTNTFVLTSVIWLYYVVGTHAGTGVKPTSINTSILVSNEIALLSTVNHSAGIDS